MIVILVKSIFFNIFFGFFPHFFIPFLKKTQNEAEKWKLSEIAISLMTNGAIGLNSQMM